MLQDRILSTLKFFDIQGIPLTLLELRKFLLANTEEIKKNLDDNFELKAAFTSAASDPVPIEEILNCLQTGCEGLVEEEMGFYCLPGRKKIIQERLENYLFGIKRERLIRRYTGILRYLPFLRGAALAGSQAFGRQTNTSDIDLFIITDPRFLWLARIFISLYFQALGKRRHGKNIADRFCLNHYLAGVKELAQGRDLYNAMEYFRFRPLLGFGYFGEFYQKNLFWLKEYFPQAEPDFYQVDGAAKIQKFFEKIFDNAFGFWLNRLLGQWQLRRIKRGDFVVADETELSFHSVKRKRALLESFFKLQQQQYGVAVKPVV